MHTCTHTHTHTHTHTLTHTHKHACTHTHTHTHTKITWKPTTCTDKRKFTNLLVSGLTATMIEQSWRVLDTRNLFTCTHTQHHSHRHGQASFSMQETEAIKQLKFVCLFVGCLTSQKQASISQGRICSDNFTCCHTEVADSTFYFTQ